MTDCTTICADTYTLAHATARLDSFFLLPSSFLPSLFFILSSSFLLSFFRLASSLKLQSTRTWRVDADKTACK